MNKNVRIVCLPPLGRRWYWWVSLYCKTLCSRGPTRSTVSTVRGRTVDIRDFISQYAAYSVEFEASVAGRGTLVGKIEPRQLQSLTEATQQANEFRKFPVAGYNSCATTAAQYAEFGIQFQALDGLARQIDALSSGPDLSDADRANLVALVSRYVEATQELGAAR